MLAVLTITVGACGGNAAKSTETPSATGPGAGTVQVYAADLVAAPFEVSFDWTDGVARTGLLVWRQAGRLRRIDIMPGGRNAGSGDFVVESLDKAPDVTAVEACDWVAGDIRAVVDCTDDEPGAQDGLIFSALQSPLVFDGTREILGITAACYGDGRGVTFCVDPTRHLPLSLEVISEGTSVTLNAVTAEPLSDSLRFPFKLTTPHPVGNGYQLGLVTSPDQLDLPAMRGN
ncbi:MAG TPA: hypothetical protein VEZ14_14910 [Dehalococcoidia bacterium]|nr:hypothetical protein [Dehalococcoidia bacterium]